MNVKFLSSASTDDEARAVWRDTTVDMIVVRCLDGLHLVFGAPLAGQRVLAGGELGIVTIFDPDGWAVYPEGPFPSINVTTWEDVLESL